jgi:hypothetical protein
MLYPMRTGRSRRSVAFATLPAAFILGAGILGAGGAAAPVRAQYPSNFEPYNAYYYSLHAPYYYYVAPEPVPSRAASTAARPAPRVWDWNWGWWGGGWHRQWGWPQGGGWRVRHR